MPIHKRRDFQPVGSWSKLGSWHRGGLLEEVWYRRWLLCWTGAGETLLGSGGQCQQLGLSPWGPLPSHLTDDPEVQVLHSIGHSAAPRLFPLAWAVLLLPLLLLQTP